MIVATWNLENFFRPGDDDPATAAAYDEKLEHLAATITAIDPDVLAVQEVGQVQALEDLKAKLGAGWHAEASAHPDGRGIRVGFLSKLAILQREDIVAFPEHLQPIQQADTGAGEAAMGRGALRIRVDTASGDLDLISCHLKSKLLSFPGHTPGTTSFAPRDEDQRARYGAYALYRRAAEATTLRAYLNAILGGHGQERGVVLMGDLNDEVSAATTQLLLGPPGSQFGTGGFSHPDAGDGARMWAIAPLIPQADRYSRTFEGQHELIDHILLSHKLADPGITAEVHHQGATSITSDPAQRANTPASDHDPVIAHLTN